MPVSEESDDYQSTTSVRPFRTPVKSGLEVNQTEDENMVTLVHTVNFYRRQQNSNSNNSTPIRKICKIYVPVKKKTISYDHTQPQHNDTEGYSEEYESDESEVADESYLVQDKIKKLLDTACKQQQVIGQTSQALNLCASTVEFSGSTESVEGERHLLVAKESDDYQSTTSVRPFRTPVKSGLEVNQTEDENMVTLVHTVNFYRRQQNSNSNNSTPIRKICKIYVPVKKKTISYDHTQPQHNDTEGYSEEYESDESEVADESYLVQDKIKKLLDTACKQQQVIGQTSQALNLCASTVEFSGSTESVEGERHLLVASK